MYFPVEQKVKRSQRRHKKGGWNKNTTSACNSTFSLLSSTTTQSVQNGKEHEDNKVDADLEERDENESGGEDESNEMAQHSEQSDDEEERDSSDWESIPRMQTTGWRITILYPYLLHTHHLHLCCHCHLHFLYFILF